MTRSRTLVVALLLLLLAGTATAYAAATRSHAPVTVVRVTQHWGQGPSAEYGSDYGGIGEVHPLTFTVPDAATAYDAVITIGLQYSTHGPGDFVVDTLLRLPHFGKVVTTRPAQLRLARLDEPTSTTVRFLARDLPAGTTYEVSPTVNSHPSSRPNRIVTSRVVLTVDLTPAS
jgi:hypothetical protein